MKILLQECLEFQELYNKIKSIVIPVDLAYVFMKINEKNKINCSFYQEEFNKILNLYCEKTEDGKLKLSDDNTSYVIIKDKVLECQQKINELNTSLVDFPQEQISKDTLEKLDKINLTFSELELILKLVEIK